MKQANNSISTLLLAILFTSFFTACNQNHNLVGEITGIGNDTILIEYAPISKFFQMKETLSDTIYSINNKFVYDLPEEEPILAFIIPKKGFFKRVNGTPYYAEQKLIVLLLKPEDKIKVKGKLEKYYINYTATGSDFNKDYSLLRKKYITETAQAVKIELQLDTLMSNNGDKELIDELFKERNRINRLASHEQLKYVKSNWDKELSAYFLTRQQLDTLGKYYEHLDAKLLDGIFKHMLEDRYTNFRKYSKVREAEQNIVEGKIAPDFKLRSLEGSDLTLGEVNNKYVVLDFWGSWCGWCIKGFPRMRKYYERYHDEVEIIGIACGDTEEKWKKSVHENELDWLHVINDEDIDLDVSVMYGVQNYPTKFILDEDKKILAKFVGESDDFYEKLDSLMQN